MSTFNFSSLQEKANQVIHNADEAVRKWQEFISAPAGNVNFQYYDKNGNLQTATFPNRNKIVNDFIANVNSVMYKVFYVDAQNGSDSNDGSQSNPFQTIKKAIDSMPSGGFAYVRLVGGQTHIIDNNIGVYNKVVILRPSDPAQKTIIKNVSASDIHGTETSGFILVNSYINFSNLTIQTADFASANDVNNPNYYSGFIRRTDGESNSICVVYESTVYLGDTPFARLSDRQHTDFIFYYKNYLAQEPVSVICNGANVDSQLIYNEKGTLRIDESNVLLGTKRDGATQLTWNDLIAGIVRDSNGVPRNILSNIVL